MAENVTRIAVTTFNQDGYTKYGRRMINAFREFWPADIKLIVVSEDPLDVATDDRVTFYDYGVLVPEGDRFKEKFGRFSQARGFMNAFAFSDARKILENQVPPFRDMYEVCETPDGLAVKPAPLPAYYDYRFDAIRFSHKVFTIFGVSRLLDCDHLFWIDGDTFTFSSIDEHFFAETDPGDGHLSYIGRDDAYSECGFLVFNRRHPIHATFLEQMTTEYLNGEVFLLPEWHDSYVWDIHREHYENTQNVVNRNISGKASGQEHPFINTVLGNYMDHLKGDERKEAGKSFESDWMPHADPSAESGVDGKQKKSAKKHPDISVIQNIKHIIDQPYPYAWVEGALPEKIYRELEETLPIDLIKNSGPYDIGGKSGSGGNYRYPAGLVFTEQKVSNIWRDFFEYHTSEEYFRSVIALFEQPLAELYPHYLDMLTQAPVKVRGYSDALELVTDCQYVVHEPLDENHTTRTPHLDNPLEIYAGLLYMKPADDTSTGGNFTIHEVTGGITEIDINAGREVIDTQLTPVAEVPYARNSFGMFLNTINSVHSVTPRRGATVDRISINIIGVFAEDKFMWEERGIE